MTSSIFLPSGCYFITGIDTNIGKTYATGHLARYLLQQGRQVITQKLIETGSQGMAQDIQKHRQLMGIDHLPDDDNKLTMPIQLSYPASPHLASKLDNRPIDVHTLTGSTNALKNRYDIVLIEGAGGLCVPLNDDLLLIDYVKQQQYPTILVTSGRLGSINHTLLSLQALSMRHMDIHALIFNHHHDSKNPIIAQDSQHFLASHLAKYYPQTHFWQMDDNGMAGLRHFVLQ